MRLFAEGLTAERGGRPVFRNLSFSVETGGLLAVTGPNGVGKSTLLRMIAGLLRPTEGSIAVEPEPDGPRGITMHYLGHLDGLKSVMTVRENLAFWRATGGADGLPPLDALDEVGLAHLIDLPAGYLSAGQRRRVAIARLLAVHRPIWLLDEPTAALDAASEVRLGELIAAHLSRGGIAVAATHLALPLPVTTRLDLGLHVLGPRT